MNNEDAISRTRLIENLEYYQKEAGWGDEWNRCIDAIIEEIEAAPSVPPQVAHGSPCDLCRYNPPSSCDGKPCTMCPAEEKMGGEDNVS